MFLETGSILVLDIYLVMIWLYCTMKQFLKIAFYLKMVLKTFSRKLCIMKNAIPMTLVALFWGAIENIANISRVFTQLPTRGRCSRYQQSLPCLFLSCYILKAGRQPITNLPKFSVNKKKFHLFEAIFLCQVRTTF